MKTITICSSANFYKKVIEIKNYLEEFGYKVIVPYTATVMEKTGDFDVSHYKSWYKNKADYHKKAELMRKHLAEVEKGDVILVVNEEKNGIKNYIGGNVLIEMALAFYQGKPIFLLNKIPNESALIEEILGMQPTCLNGGINKLPEKLDK